MNRRYLEPGSRAEGVWTYVVYGGFFLVWTGAAALLWRPRVLPFAGLFWLKVPLWLAPVALLAAFRQSWAADFGIVRPSYRAVGLAIGAIALVALGEATRVHWFDPRPLHWPSPSLMLLEAQAPLLEELLFRGAIQPALVRYHGTILGIAITSLLFLLIHVPGWVVLPPAPGPISMIYIFGLGLFLGGLRQASGTIWVPLLAHWANNIGGHV